MFDEVLGQLAGTGKLPRTAYLHVDYRSISPIGVDLDFTSRFVKEEGRKRFLTVELRHADALCVDVEGLFAELRPGHP
ncbi:hypothetical protein [Arthrobacter mobilis]|uniref:Thioesterase superfamily protein n=1 Tax=Arthrobacter mobilis TaxID=2724944 RepID=A0A7X6K7G8_9MICC|nr:hypothetical protein [Arthrobacter mobilis]NKX56578.1 hypothetical protein [Arthrobacter mobilis]